MTGSRRLVVIPSDPIATYERAGYDALDRYFNPLRFFEEVFAVSPLERGERRAHGLTIIGVTRARMGSVLRELRPDVVRAYGGHWPAYLACRNRLDGVPVLVSVHDTHESMVRRWVRYADLVLCVSRAVERRVLAFGAEPRRIRLLPNRVDTTVFRRVTDPAAIGTVASRFPPGRHILHVGRKTAQKNLDTLIGALAVLPEEYSAVFVGMGDDAPYRALAVKLGVADRCFWLEAVANADLPVWYSWSDCFCVPSRWEGFGTVFIEAAACGAAIVTSDIAPMNEFLTHEQSACLVRAYEDPAALAAAIRRASEDEAYRSLIAAGALEVAGRFERTRVDALEVDMYREALALAPPRPRRRLELAVWRAEEAIRGVVRGPFNSVRRAVRARVG